MERQEILANIYPILKPADWQGREMAFCHPLIPAVEHPALPWVGYGFDSPHSLRFLDLEEAEEQGWSPATDSSLIQAALANLIARKPRLKITQLNLHAKEITVVMVEEDFFAAEQILNSEFLALAHRRLKNNRLLVSIPRRGVIACAPAFGEWELNLGFGFWTAQDYFLAASAPISPNLFLVEEGKLRDMSTGSYVDAARLAVEKAQQKLVLT